MRRLKFFLLVLLNSIFVNAQIQVNITGTYDNNLVYRAKINIENLFNAINSAYDTKSEINLHGINITNDCADKIRTITDFTPMKITVNSLSCNAIQIGGTNDYEIRDIPVEIEEFDSVSGSRMNSQEVAISFDKNTAQITGLNIAVKNYMRSSILKSNKSVTDERRKTMILSFIEQFRTAYNTKDIEFLQQIYSDDAIIITGKVIKVQKSEVNPDGEIVKYTRETKQQYLNKLSQIFRANKRINVTFDNIIIKMHPIDADWYGVTLKQGFTSDGYHDDGYVFLLWDFSDESHPTIHVRTWQPNEYIESDDDVYSLDDFNIHTR